MKNMQNFRQISQRGILVSFLLFAFGCTSAHFAPSDVSQHFSSRTESSKLKIYRTERPEKRFIEIGSVNACCGDTEKLVELLRKSASDNGGDALIGLEPYSGGGYSATVIRFSN